jgi:low affinity Fe/Cu permease
MSNRHPYPFGEDSTMASKRSRASAAPNATVPPAVGSRATKSSPANSPVAKAQDDAGQHHKSWHQLFSDMACGAARYAGHPIAFLTAALLVIAWAVTGPLFGFSDTWQLVINTSTTIVTFLMVFLIQHTQNRDTLAVQLKLAELIIAVKGAENRLATAEDLSEKELEQLHEDYRHRADEALDHLNRRRAQLKHAS